MTKKTVEFLALVLIGCAINSYSAVKRHDSDGHWVSVWASSMLAPVHFPGMPDEPAIADETIRMVVRPTLGGQRLRVRLSNEFGTSPLVVGAAHIALTNEGSKIKAGTDRVLTFGGNTKVTIPAGAPMVSDP